MENNKQEIINVHVPHVALLKESRESILIQVYGDQVVWISKKFFRDNIGSFFRSYRIGLIPNWKYKIYLINHTNIKEAWDVHQEVTGIQLAELLTAPHCYFKHNLPNKKW